MFGTMGFSELIIILVIVLIIFGAGRLPQIGEGVGKALKGFRKEVTRSAPTRFRSVPTRNRATTGNSDSDSHRSDRPAIGHRIIAGNDQAKRSLCPWSGTDARHHRLVAVQYEPSDSANIDFFSKSSIGVFCLQSRAIDGGTDCSSPSESSRFVSPLAGWFPGKTDRQTPLRHCEQRCGGPRTGPTGRAQSQSDTISSGSIARRPAASR